MRAEFQKEFDNKFVLEETHIRKLNEIILTRVPEGQMRITVKKADGVEYETQDFEEMLTTESASLTKTLSITITFTSQERSASVQHLSLAFDKPQSDYSYRKGLILQIQGEKVDDVNLLGDDLLRYLNSSVVKPKLDPVILFLSSALLFVSIFFVIYAQGVFDPKTGLEAAAVDITTLTTNSEKLDYLIALQTQKPELSPLFITFVSGILLFTFISVLSISHPPSRLFHKFFPKYVYVLGIEATEYHKLTSLKKNIFWTVIVGSGISTVTGLIVWYMTKQ